MLDLLHSLLYAKPDDVDLLKTEPDYVKDRYFTIIKTIIDVPCCSHPHPSPLRLIYPRPLLPGGDIRCSICYIPGYTPDQPMLTS